MLVVIEKVSKYGGRYVYVVPATEITVEQLNNIQSNPDYITNITYLCDTK